MTVDNSLSLNTSLAPEQVSLDRDSVDSAAVDPQGTELKPELDRDSLLAEIILRICNSLNPMEILKAMVTEVRLLLNVERVVIYRFESNWNQQVIAESIPENLPSLMGKQIENDGSAQEWLRSCQKGQVKATSDIYQEPFSPAHLDLLKSLNIRAHVLVPLGKPSKPPLRNQESDPGEDDSNPINPISCQLTTVLSAQHCSAPREWKSDELDFLTSLSTHVAIALQQAELHVAIRTAMFRHQRAEVKVLQSNGAIKRTLMDRMEELEAANAALHAEIHRRDQLEERLFQEKELAQVTLQSMGDAVITTDATGRVVTLNPTAEKLTGWQSPQSAGLPLENVFKIVAEGTRTPLDCPAQKAIESSQTVYFSDHTLLIAKDNAEYPIQSSISPIFNRDRQLIGTVLVFHDVTKSRQLEKLLSWQATHDPLTGLINRRKFEEHITSTLESGSEVDPPSVLCYLDLDRFKLINDTCGHLAGDELLKQISTLLQKRIRSSDILARLGGDEFGLLLHHCALEKAAQIATALVELIQAHRFTWEGKTYHIGMSMGLVALGKNCKGSATALSTADAACYEAKKQGGSNVQISTPISPETTPNDYYWVGQVHSAIEEQRLQLYSQKITALTQTSDCDMSEVLLRFIDEEGKLLLPEALILAAEKFHLTRSIDQWVVRTFCEAYHHQTQYNPLLYTINLSGESINNVPFTQFLVDQIQQHQVPPDRICFEITETAAIANLAKASELIHGVKALGCRFALDDFGSGMSSLAYLKTLPVDYLKIDGAFIQHLATSPIDYSIVECFNRLSHDMGIQTIAEWVEDEPTLIKLKAIGVDYVQGYGISRPSPLLLL